MDGDVNTAIKEGNVELASKETLATNVCERLIENFVTSCLFVKDGKGCQISPLQFVRHNIAERTGFNAQTPLYDYLDNADL